MIVKENKCYSISSGLISSSCCRAEIGVSSINAALCAKQPLKICFYVSYFLNLSKILPSMKMFF